MKISLNWLSDYLDVAPIRADLKGVLSKLTMRGLEVESIHDLSKGFDKVVVALLETRDRHPNADRLSVCKVNNGKETLQIVCGAQNMKAGDKVALSMIGAHLPNGLKIEKGKIRDVESFGMLCSEVELGLADQSEGIMILPADAKVGTPLATQLGREDIVFELNVTPNRGDALSHIGVARELASILGQKLKLPSITVSEAGGNTSDKIKVALQNPEGAPDLCLQYHARFIEGVKIKPSPEWLKKRLTSIGLRPINNIVDITNFILMEWGQPLHAFDYAQIKGGQIQVRLAKKGEKLPLLDATTVELDASDLVIADAERPVALAGVMGGGNSEVTEKTTSLLLEAAQFLPATVRKTARRHQKNSDSSHRFERQIDARAVRNAMDRAVALIVELGGGKAYKGAVSKYSPLGERLAKGEPRVIEMSIRSANKFLGTMLSQVQAVECLKLAGFDSEVSGDRFRVTVPSYRTDVELPEDLFEEILRVWGYDKIEARVPRMEFMPEPATATDLRSRLIEKLKLGLAEQGFNEAVNFAFTSKVTNEFWGGEEKKLAVELANPLNEQFTTMKTSLLGGLFENFMTSARHQQRNLRLFEVRPVYLRDEKTDTGMREDWRLTAICSGRSFSSPLDANDRDLDFFDAKGFLELALETVGARGVRYMAFEAQGDSRLHPAQAARVAIGRGPCGMIGRLHPKVEAEHKLRQPVFVFEISLDRALEVAKTERKFTPVAKFPKVERDLSLLVPQSLLAEKVVQTIQKLGKPLVETVSVVDTYAGEKIPAGLRSLSVSFVLGDATRTLEDGEVDLITQKILTGLDKEIGVKLRIQ